MSTRSLIHRRYLHSTRTILAAPPTKKGKTRYNYNTSLSWEEEPDPDHLRYRRVTAKELRGRKEVEAVRRVKMLVRDWVDDGLYNPHYGYFAKQATIFSTRPSAPPSTSAPSTPAVPSPTTSTTTDITSHPNLTSFQEAIAEAYEREYGAQVFPAGTGEGAGDDVAVGGSGKGGRGGLGRQVWHTPTELFRPFYSRIIARALLSHYKLHHYPHSPLRIYEIGAGNGSLMVDVLSFLRDKHPEVFERTRYEVVEISAALAERQKQQAEMAGFSVELVKPGQERRKGAVATSIKNRPTAGEGKAQVRISNVDFFDWAGSSKDSCYFIALEVFDNFAHDMIRYNLETLEPMQAVVTIDATGDFSLLYEPVTDPVIRRYLGYRRLVSGNNATNASGPFSSSHLPVSATPPINPLLLSSPLLRKIYTSLPFAPNLSAPEFIPTKQILFLEKLREALPFHRLLVSDFDSLPDAVAGRNGPVVQTRYGGEMVPCETFLVKQGYFDIFFPTDFGMLKEMYSLIMTSPPRKLSSDFFSPHRLPESSKPLAGTPPDLIGVRGFKHRHVGVYDHAEFLTRFGSQDELKGTTTRDGDNVMLSMYKNVKFMF